MKGLWKPSPATACMTAVVCTCAWPNASYAFFPPFRDVPPTVIIDTVPPLPPDPFPIEAIDEKFPDLPPEAPPIGTISQTPEPASIVTGLTGLAMISGWMWRRKRKWQQQN